MKKIILFIIIFIGSLSPVFSQPNMQWANLYQNNYAKSLAVDNSGNVFVTGWGWGNGIHTIKYNSSGVQQWNSQYRGIDNGNDFAFSIITDRLGNIYVTGWSQGGGNATDIITIKYGASGDTSWVSRYRGPAVSSSVPGFEPYVKLIAVDDSGNVYVTGTSYGGSTTGFDYATIKYNSSGVQQWAQRYNNSIANNVDYATAIMIDAGGNVYVSGFSDADAAGTIEDFCTIKYSANGVMQWTSRYNNGAHNRVNALTMDNTGNIYAAGWGGPAVLNGPGGYLTVKYNNAGVQMWAMAYPGGSYDEASSIVVKDPDNIYVTGGLTVGSSSDFLTIKYNSLGVQQWTRAFNGTANGYDKANAIALDRNGNIYITGSSNNGGSVFDYATLKYDNAGNLLWNVRYNDGSSNCTPTALVVDTSNNFYVTGSSGNKFMTLKYSQLTGIISNNNNIPDKFSLSQNYPNPFNPTTNIGFRIADFGFVSLKIFDITGKEVQTLVDKSLQPGSYEVTWDASNMPSGVYFYKLTAADFSETKRMVLIK